MKLVYMYMNVCFFIHYVLIIFSVDCFFVPRVENSELVEGEQVDGRMGDYRTLECHKGFVADDGRQNFTVECKGDVYWSASSLCQSD